MKDNQHVLSSRVVTTRLAALACIALVTTGCAGVDVGPAYDAWESNPRHATDGNQLVVFQRDSATARDASASSVVRSTDLKDADKKAYEEWKREKGENSATYEEFIEYRDWLEFKRLKKRGN